MALIALLPFRAGMRPHKVHPSMEPVFAAQDKAALAVCFCGLARQDHHEMRKLDGDTVYLCLGFATFSEAPK